MTGKAQAPLQGTLSGHISFLMCSADTCMPQRQDIVFEPLSKRSMDVILQNMPQPCDTMHVYRDGSYTYIEIGARGKYDTAYFFSEKPIKQSCKIMDDTRICITLYTKSLNHLKGIVKIGDASFQVNKRVPIKRSLFEWPLLLAFLGGLLLNLMPCVLPVTSIKLIYVLERPAHPIRSAFMFAGGIISAFVGVAFVLASIKAAGHKVGWGFQLQSPFFVFFLCSIFLSLSLNLFGIFDIGKRITRLPRLFPHTSLFFSGVLTTLVATPCTAPFMGTALSYAFTQGYFKLFLVFFFLGLGMSMPMLCAPFIPGLNKVMPKPGPWLSYLKDVLAFGLLGTLIWLLYLLVTLTCPYTLLWSMFGLLIIAFALWMWEKVFWVGFSLALAGFSFGLYNIYMHDKEHFPEHTVFSKSVLMELKQQHPVLLTFSANWCLSCQMNHRALTSLRVLEKMREKGVIFMVGDWTKKDPKIAEFLDEHDKVSIPFTVLYVGDKHYVLPQILTEKVILKYLSYVHENTRLSSSQ